MSSEASMRASDRDRDRATEVLREAYAAGRLTTDEFSQRVGAACSARTWGELADLTADLPESWLVAFADPEAGPDHESIEVCQVPKRPRAPLWIMASIWLFIAAAAHVFAALPLALLAVFVLRADRWR